MGQALRAPPSSEFGRVLPEFFFYASMLITRPFKQESSFIWTVSADTGKSTCMLLCSPIECLYEFTVDI